MVLEVPMFRRARWCWRSRCSGGPDVPEVPMFWMSSSHPRNEVLETHSYGAILVALWLDQMTAKANDLRADRPRRVISGA